MEGQTEHPEYLHLDTDGLTEYKDERIPSSLFKSIVIPDMKELRIETQRLDEFQKEVINISVGYAKDIVKSRRDGNSAPKPIYLIVHGGAGAGKSTVISLVSKWCHSILAKDGDDVECPYIIKTAFTGTAASNIEGQTLHTSFSFNFDNKHYSLSDKKRDEKRTLFKNLMIVIIDEVSMVKADMLYQLDLKLQEIKERVGTPFGGVSILVFGDMLQLRPVLGAFPFEKPKNPEFNATFELQNRWDMFRVLTLEVNHRQGDDKEYADILNRIRAGKMTADDEIKLNTRVRCKGHPDLADVSLYIVPTRKACARYNQEHLDSIPTEEIILKAVHYHATQKNYKPFIEKKEGAIGTTSFLNEIRIKLGAKVMLIHNIDTVDGLTNGQLGELIDIVTTADGKVDKLIIKLQKHDAGIANRRKYPGIAMKYKGAIVVERVSINYSLRKKGGNVGSTATLVQFPIKLAFAITAHKIQGQTIPKPLKVAFDLITIFEEAQGYVMLSRVQELNQIFIIEDFDPQKIYPSRKAIEEVLRMDRISINKNPTEWNQNQSTVVKIMSMNCAGLKYHIHDIQRDSKVLKADLINFLEVSLEDIASDNNYSLEEYSHNILKMGLGKGIGTYFKTNKFEVKDILKSEKFQVVKCGNEVLDVLSVYRSQGLNTAQLLDELKKRIDRTRVTLIIGDFNLCYYENQGNKLIRGLISLGFTQLMHEPTHIRGRIIDHAYFLDPTN